MTANATSLIVSCVYLRPYPVPRPGISIEFIAITKQHRLYWHSGVKCPWNKPNKSSMQLELLPSSTGSHQACIKLGGDYYTELRQNSSES